MNEFKGTPGPWYGKTIPLHPIHFERHKSCIAHVSSTGEETKANAEIILSAPDLLEALEIIADYWNQDKNELAMADACWFAINTAQEAIAKAIGQGEGL